MSSLEGSAPASGLSVIIPCYNAARFLPALLDSLRAQTEPADEIIAVESHSSDHTLDILEQYARTLPIRIEQRPRLGIYPAWNDGVALARHSLCYVACADDLVYPDAFRHLRQLREQVPYARMYTWPVDVIDSRGEIIVPGGSPIVKLLWQDWADIPHVRAGIADSLTALSMGSPYLSMMGVAFSAELWQETQGFDAAYGPAGDVAWQVRAGLRTDIAFSPRTLAAWRVHGQGATGLTTIHQRVGTARRIFEELSPIVLSQLGLRENRSRQVSEELQMIQEQAHLLTALSSRIRALRRGNVRGLLDPVDRELVGLSPQLLRFKLRNPRTSVLGLPAARLRKLLISLGLSRPVAIETPGLSNLASLRLRPGNVTETI